MRNPKALFTNTFQVRYRGKEGVYGDTAAALPIPVAGGPVAAGAFHGGLNGAVLPSLGGICGGAGGPVKGNRRCADGSGKIERPGIATDNQVHPPEHRDELPDAQPGEEPHRSADLAGDLFPKGLLVGAPPVYQYGRPRVLRHDPARQFRPSLRIPQFGAPGGSHLEKNDQTLWQFRPVALCGCLVLRSGVDGARQLHALVVPVERDADHPQVAVGNVLVAVPERDAAGSEKSIHLFLQHLPGEAYPFTAAAKPGDQAALQVPLDVEDQVVGAFPQPLAQGHQVAAGLGGKGGLAPFLRPDGEDPPQAGVVLQHRKELLFGHPVDLDSGRHLVQIVYDRQGVDDVAQGGGLDDQDFQCSNSLATGAILIASGRVPKIERIFFMVATVSFSCL